MIVYTTILFYTITSFSDANQDLRMRGGEVVTDTGWFVSLNSELFLLFITDYLSLERWNFIVSLYSYSWPFASYEYLCVGSILSKNIVITGTS